MSLNIPPLPAGTQTYTTTSNWLTAAANEVARESTRFLTALEGDAGVNFTTAVGNLPTFNPVVWIGETPGILDVPTRPVISLANISTLLQQFATLTPPTAPAITFSYTEPGYNSQLRQPMIEKLLDDVVNGGYGIDTNDEIALFNRARDREAMIGAATVDEVRRQAAATSFPLPQGSLYAALQRARQDELAKNSSVNRDITLKRADLFVENRRRVIEQIVAVEGQDMALYNAIQNRIMTAAQIEVQLAVSLFDAALRLFSTQVQALTSQIDAEVDTANALVRIYASDVAAYAAFVNAIVAGAGVDIANSRTIMERDTRFHQSKVDDIKFSFQKLMSTIENRKQINSFATDFFRTGFGAAINGVNGLAVQSGTV